jgi:thymidylate kinase
MAKPEKKNSKKDRGKSSKDTKPRGRLVALEGTNGVMLRSEAERLACLCCGAADPAWSLWDASNTFYELRMVKARNLTPTPRVLLLLYASDLLFRLRWEIEPTLKEGRTVVAAPYVESAMAFGVAAGLPKGWIKELFRFAPKPAVSFRLKEKKKDQEKKKDGDGEPGFVEFFCASLARHYPGWETADVRREMLKYLKSLEELNRIHEFGNKPCRIKRALKPAGESD